MNKKVSIGVLLAIVFISIAATIAVTMSVSIAIYNKLIVDLPGRAQMYSGLTELDELVRKEYFGTIDSDALSSKTSAGYVSGLGDPNSFYMTAEEYVSYYSKLQGKTYGIGARVCLDPETGYIYVAKVFDNSPAYTSGLREGDRITAVEGVAATASNYNTLVEQLTGKKLSSVKLTYLRNGNTTEASIVKGNSGQSVFFEDMGEVAYIRITEFYSNTPTQLASALEKVTGSTTYKSIILDVRGNYEGNLEYAVKALDLIVPTAAEGQGSVAKVIDKNGEEIATYTSDAQTITMPMIVLTDSSTAGPAELFACDLRDFGKAQMLGETTKGVGTATELFQLKDGSAVLLTIGEIIPYKSESYNGKGVVPDYQVELSADKKAKFEMLTSQEDTQLQEAVKLLSSSSTSSGTNTQQ